MLCDAVRDLILTLEAADKTYWIAYSGGLDSQVLLSLCQALRQDYPICFRAIHVNHHLSPHSKKWAQHCEIKCAEYGIDFIEKAIQMDLSNGDSLEEVAREKRYAAFAECLQAGDILLTAHQQDDQAETLLLQLLRGAGPKGLAAMPALKPFASGFHGRPLLHFSRADLQKYAEEHQLQWIEDESNDNIQHSRNFIRHEILPKLMTRWPTATKTISRSATHCAESQVLLEEFALAILKNMEGSNGAATLSVTKLLLFDQARQRLMLRSWIKLNGFPLPDTKKIETIRNEVLMASKNAMPYVTWEGAEMRRYRDDLYLMKGLEKHEVDLNVHWDISQPLSLRGVGILSVKRVEGGGLRADIQHVSVRFRQGGEVVGVPGRGRHTLKNLFQEWDIPTWERDRLPLLFIEEKCIGAVGFCLDAEHVAKQGEIGLMPHLDRH